MDAPIREDFTGGMLIKLLFLCLSTVYFKVELSKLPHKPLISLWHQTWKVFNDYFWKLSWGGEKESGKVEKSCIISNLLCPTFVLWIAPLK